MNVTLNIDELILLLLGKKKLPNVTPWRSQIRALSQAITFVESDFFLSHKLLSHPELNSLSSQKSPRVLGITGLPGAGKSSLTNLIVKKLRSLQKTVAVLAVDPSSPMTGGAILGDRVRMQDHFRDEYVYIRSMSSRGALGGVARSTRAAIRMAGLLNFDFIIVETVGIGQSESEIINIADTTALVLMPNSGDEIQLMKAGVLQLANIYIVNKCDLGNASRMIQELKENMAHVEEGQWKPPVLMSSATDGQGLNEIVDQFLAHAQFEKEHPVGKQVKLGRVKKEVLQSMISIMEEKFLKELENCNSVEFEKIIEGKMTAFYLAKSILNEGH